MADQAARITGLVLSVKTRSGSKVNQDTGEVRNWSMTTARILVGGEDICDVTVPEDVAARPDFPDRGDGVDWLVSIRAGGKYLNIDYTSPWTDAHTQASAA